MLMATWHLAGGEVAKMGGSNLLKPLQIKLSEWVRGMWDTAPAGV